MSSLHELQNTLCTKVALDLQTVTGKQVRPKGGYGTDRMPYIEITIPAGRFEVQLLPQHETVHDTAGPDEIHYYRMIITQGAKKIADENLAKRGYQKPGIDAASEAVSAIRRILDI